MKIKTLLSKLEKQEKELEAKLAEIAKMEAELDLIDKRKKVK